MNFQLIGMFSTSFVPKLQATSSHWPWHWRSVARTKLDETSQSAKMWKVGTVLLRGWMNSRFNQVMPYSHSHNERKFRSLDVVQDRALPFLPLLFLQLSNSTGWPVWKFWHLRTGIQCNVHVAACTDGGIPARTFAGKRGTCIPNSSDSELDHSFILWGLIQCIGQSTRRDSPFLSISSTLGWLGKLLKW